MSPDEVPAACLISHPCLSAGYPDRQEKVAGLFGSDSLSSPCHSLLLDRQPGRVPMGSWEG